MQDQLDEGDYELDGRKEKTLLDKLHKKLTTQLKITDIDLDDKKERYKYLSAAPVLANMYLLIKVHKKNFPGRAVVNQTDDPTYKICLKISVHSPDCRWKNSSVPGFFWNCLYG